MFNDVLAYLETAILRDEGERLKPYLDTKGRWTIGRGRNLTDVGISKSESKIMYDNDVAAIIFQLNSKLPWWRDLPEPHQYVLLNMSFMGVGKLLGFKNMLAAMKAGDNERAAAELLDSDYARDVGNRALRLAEIVRTCEYL